LLDLLQLRDGVSGESNRCTPFPQGEANGMVTLGRLLKNAHLLRFPHSSSLRRTTKYVSLLKISEALHLDIFEQPEKMIF
jgi:hypothetical protein